jgi:hypothetical protein
VYAIGLVLHAGLTRRAAWLGRNAFDVLVAPAERIATLYNKALSHRAPAAARLAL